MIENVMEFFFDGWGKLVLAFGGLAALVTAFALDQRHIGATNAIAEANKSAEVLVGKIDAAGRAAEQPGAADRLRKQYCRDC